MRNFGKAWTSLLALGILAATQAWNGVGHQVIATVAYSKLSAKARKEADRLLAASTDGSPSFVISANWADEHRTPTTGPWHYEDHHFRLDGKPDSNKPDQENAVWAIRRFSAVLADKSQSDAVRGQALRYLIHFVGDIHQPLHAATLDTEMHPDGDRGGNDFHIAAPDSLSGGRPPKNLHALWDMGGGLFLSHSREPDAGQVSELAKSIEGTFNARHLHGLAKTDPETWALESFSDAKQTAYALAPNSVPSDEYLTKARKLSAERAARAGYRLATLLNGILGK